MLSNYLKIAIRNLLKHKVYTIINALGLSIGIGSCLFILAITQNELSFDNYHENRDRIYRLTDKIQVSETRELHTAQSPAPWAPEMQQLYSDVEASVRFSLQSHAIQHKEDQISETILYSDPSIFNIFTYPLIKGDPKTALKQTYSVAISEDMAEKYFEQEDPVGKTLLFDNKQEYLVTAVMKNVPKNSYYHFDFIVPFEGLAVRNPELMQGWRSHWIHSYLLLNENASPAVVEARFPEFINTHIDEEFRERYHPELQRFSDLHLKSDLSGEWGDTLDALYLYIFGAIAVFVLLIACINFMNLATARSANRAKEVGMRKVLGAYRPQLVRQFLTESTVISFLALILAIGLVEFALPWFNSITDGGRKISINYFENNVYVISVFVITLLVGILAGCYPAFFLSKFQPIGALTAASAKARGAILRKALVISQFSIAIFMIIANVLLVQQIDFLKNKDLGFEKNNIIYFSPPENNSYDRQVTIKSELRRNPAINSVFTSSHEPGDGYMFGRFIPEGSSDQDGMMLKHIAVDENYFPTLKIPLVAGRNFSREFATDTTDAVIINETAAKQFGWKEPVGKTIKWLEPGFGSPTRMVIGIVRDFNFESLHEPIQPLIVHTNPKQQFRYFVSVEPTTADVTYDLLKEQWRTYNPNNPTFSYYLSVDLELEYRFEGILSDLLIKFTVLTILIACLGLIGLASFTAEQRTKEIGIRKVLGANTPKIVVMLSSEFLKLVLLANIFAWPLAYFGMNAWLGEFAYHINIGWWTFLACGAIAATIAWLTIGFQALRASLANPIDALRYE
jgi:putative ABC transport system permease protein